MARPKQPSIRSGEFLNGVRDGTKLASWTKATYPPILELPYLSRQRRPSTANQAGIHMNAATLTKVVYSSYQVRVVKHAVNFLSFPCFDRQHCGIFETECA